MVSRGVQKTLLNQTKPRTKPNKTIKNQFFPKKIKTDLIFFLKSSSDNQTRNIYSEPQLTELFSTIATHCLLYRHKHHSGHWCFHLDRVQHHHLQLLSGFSQNTKKERVAMLLSVMCYSCKVGPTRTQA